MPTGGGVQEDFSRNGKGETGKVDKFIHIIQTG
jgi:hypothetical protein